MKYTAGTELYPADRLELHAKLIDDVMAAGGVRTARKSLGVIVTAGPPGVGKSTALEKDARFADFRDIDADDFKDELLIDARRRGDITRWLSHELGDGRSVSERELSAFVHAESTTIANTMRNRCLASGENVIIHGTLSSLMHTDEILQDLNQYGYHKLTIFDVERPSEQAVEQALRRWWDDRIADRDGLGGRFVARKTIEDQYEPGAIESRCADNAIRLRSQAELLDWNVELVKL
jgi:hypothetical protein